MIQSHSDPCLVSSRYRSRAVSQCSRPLSASCSTGPSTTQIRCHVSSCRCFSGLRVVYPFFFPFLLLLFFIRVCVLCFALSCPILLFFFLSPRFLPTSCLSPSPLMLCRVNSLCITRGSLNSVHEPCCRMCLLSYDQEATSSEPSLMLTGSCRLLAQASLPS